MKLIVRISVVICWGILHSCHNESSIDSNKQDIEESSKQKTPSADSLDISASELQIISQNWKCFRGTIADSNAIYLEYKIINDANEKRNLIGSYHYLNNHVSFPLEGFLLADGTVELYRKKEGKIRESFYFVLEGDGEDIYGNWSKASVKSELILKPKYRSTDQISSFFFAVKEILNSKHIPKHFEFDYSGIQNLEISNNGIIKSSGFNGYWCGKKVGVQSDQKEVLFTHLPSKEMMGVNPGMNIMMLELENKASTYHCYVRIFNLEGGEITPSQNINWTGEGKAFVYYFENRIILNASDRKEVLYWNEDISRLVEK